MKERFEWYRKMQKERPVYYDPDFQTNFGAKGAWHVFRYEDVKRVMSDYETFSAQVVPLSDNPLSVAINNMDPPHHKFLRAVVSAPFAASELKKLEPIIQQISEELLEPHLENEEMDLVKYYSTPIPIYIIARLLGVPFSEMETFQNWGKRLSSNLADEDAKNYSAALQEVSEYFSELIEERKVNPQEDLISYLIQVDIDGQKLTPKELLAMCIVLLVAGNETTVNLIANSVLTLTEHPQLQEHLQQHPEDLPKFINEVLRYRAPIQSMNRIAIKDVELSGQVIKKGDYINSWLGAANHDETIFPNPEIIDIHRKNLHLVSSFGHGIHFCVGAPLARLESRIALGHLLSKIEQIRLKPDTKLEFHPSTIHYSLKSLPIQFQRRSA